MGDDGGRWKPQDGEKYYFVSDMGEVMRSVFDSTLHQQIFRNTKLRYEIGNCYRTREEAEAAVKRVLAAYIGGMGE